MPVSRRDFFRACGASGCLLAGASLGAGATLLAPGPAAAQPPRVHPARFWKRLAHHRIKCELCPKQCEVDDRERGFCGVRENQGGEYRTLVWGQAAAVNVDPIEKKPFFHFMPGSRAFSLATAGCNLECKCCQNWQLSQSRPEQLRWRWLPPEDVVRHAASYQACVAFTYTEPIVFLEYVIDTCTAARRAGVRTAMITGGSAEVAPLREALKVLDAVKVDLKGFTEGYYQKLCKGKLAPVLRSIETIRQSGVWLELVHLCIPGHNDAEGEIRDMCRWIKRQLGPDVPLHFTRFHPDYQLRNVPPTPYETLVRCRQIGLAEGLRFVYTGNVPGVEGEHTSCPRCRKIVVRRHGFDLRELKVQHGRCGFCGHAIPGVWA
ncbi:MAG TPA: AmmeMemoRadiSam system radical SAM enzyme [Polyangia bacterium]